MNFDFTEEQVMLRESITRFIQEDYKFDERRRISKSSSGIDKEVWKTFAQLGWLSIPFSENSGGFGGGPVDVSVIMEEFGKGLVLEPYLPTVLLFGGLINSAGNEEQCSDLLPKIIEGDLLGAFAYLERQSRYELTDVMTKVESHSEGFILDGEKVVVLNGLNASKLIVSARTSGDQFDREGISLFLVSADAEGVDRVSYQMMDGQMVSNVRFNNVSLGTNSLIGSLGEGSELIERVVREATVAISAEALGIMGELNRKTLEYSKTRKQFGSAIGSFQVLQHRMVDTFMAYEQVKSLLYRAVCGLAEDSDDIECIVHALKALVGKMGKQVFGEAIQIHGGMGITDELDIGHYAKRLMMINTTFGGEDHHQGKFNNLRYGYHSLA